MTVDLFWEQADLDGSDENPLIRELGNQLDALARFAEQIEEANAVGRDTQVEVLLEQQAQVERHVRRLRRALATRSGLAGAGPHRSPGQGS